MLTHRQGMRMYTQTDYIAQRCGTALEPVCVCVCVCVQAAYDRILELRIATPQIILNYANFLQVRTCCLCARARVFVCVYARA